MRSRTAIIGLVGLLAVLGLLDVTGSLGALIASGGAHFSPQSAIGPVEVGGLSEADAMRRVEAYVAPLGGVGLAIEGERTVRASWDEMGVRFDVRESVVRALAKERRTLLHSLLNRLGAPTHPLLWSLDEERMNAFAQHLASRVYEPPKNATISLARGEVSPERAGRRLEIERFSRVVAEAAERYANRRVATNRAGIDIHPLVSPIAPAVTASRLQGLLARGEDFAAARLTGFTTHYDSSNKGRSNNLELAARLIDGIVLEPGDRFSFNEIVGPRRLDLGFLPAPEIVGEEFVEGVGGGICQVSSTLFNAVLYADLKVAERYRHSVPLGYVPPGRDATLHYGVMDFAFVNSSDQTISIRAEAANGSLKVMLWGEESLPYSVALRSEEKPIEPSESIEVDHALDPGERVVDAEGAAGRWIYLHKRVTSKSDGRIIADELVSRNHYPPKDRKVRVGPETAPADGEAVSEEVDGSGSD